MTGFLYVPHGATSRLNSFFTTTGDITEVLGIDIQTFVVCISASVASMDVMAATDGWPFQLALSIWNGLPYLERQVRITGI